MKAKVAVQVGLDGLKEEIANAGYQVVSLEETGEQVDAMIISGVTCEWAGGISIENVEMNLNKTGQEENILILNVVEMTNAEAVDLLKSRLST